METESEADEYIVKIKEIVTNRMSDQENLPYKAVLESQEVLHQLGLELDECQRQLNGNHTIGIFKSCCSKRLGTAMSKISILLAKNNGNQSLQSRNLLFISVMGLWAFSKFL
jgi:hypothetical protein